MSKSRGKDADDFLQGVCVALQHVKATCSVTWAEIVRSIGEDDLLNYAAHVEPAEWELAGFNEHAMGELRRAKPRRAHPVSPLAPVSEPLVAEAERPAPWVPVSERLPGFMDRCDWLFPPNALKQERWVLCAESMAFASVPGRATHWRLAEKLPTIAATKEEAAK